ncbi:hypothetical protein RHMOL_Rhmol11G0228200 [Rhododendron molle]|uniref:Uncharacterized protein n=1 Tax=Rhododendron molle TaxID=49168 RepID=A0ACC0LWU7_RHOML|nr:hypothetical protein RHMOL_Rhmol11G0228200 [Rhododendron molle]
MGFSGSAPATILGFEHHVVMLGTTVIIPSIIVPLMGGGQVANCLEIGLPELIILIILTQYIPRRIITKIGEHFFERYAVPLSIAIVWPFAALLTASGAYKNKSSSTQVSCHDQSRLISGAAWISFPYPWQWGTPSADAGDVSVIIAAALVALIEGIDWLLNGSFGTASGSTVSVAASAGLDLLQFCNFDKLRTKFIIGFSIFMGLSVPQYFYGYMGTSGCGLVHTHANWFDKVVEIIFTSPATVAAMIAVFLDCTIPPGRTDNGGIETDTDWEDLRTT